MAIHRTRSQHIIHPRFGDVLRAFSMTDNEHSACSDDMQAGRLKAALSRNLEREEISYCLFKSNPSSASHQTDQTALDFLVSRSHALRLAEVLLGLGFKQASTTASEPFPGLICYSGLDLNTGAFMKVRTYVRLVIAGGKSRIYYLPIDDSFFEATVQGRLFKIPSTELEYVVSVLGLVLRPKLWSRSLRGQPRSAERDQLRLLAKRVNENRLNVILRRQLPFLDEGLWARCLLSLQSQSPVRLRMTVARQVHKLLAANEGQRSISVATLQLVRSTRTLQRRARRGLGCTLQSGGALIAIVGGDGAGKSSAVDELHASLSAVFSTKKLHLGKPPWSVTTIVVKGLFFLTRRTGWSGISRARAFEMGTGTVMQYPGNAWVVWHLLKARDRKRAYVRARRFAASGGLVVCDRFPLPEIKLMDCARTTCLAPSVSLGRLARYLVHRERSYYEDFGRPDVLIVLKVHPDIAVERKPEEDPDFVRARACEVWNADWTGTLASLVDASLPRGHLSTEIKRLAWSAL